MAILTVIWLYNIDLSSSPGWVGNVLRMGMVPSLIVCATTRRRYRSKSFGSIDLMSFVPNMINAIPGFERRSSQLNGDSSALQYFGSDQVESSTPAALKPLVGQSLCTSAFPKDQIRLYDWIYHRKLILMCETTDPLVAARPGLAKESALSGAFTFGPCAGTPATSLMTFSSEA